MTYIFRLYTSILLAIFILALRSYISYLYRQVPRAYSQGRALYSSFAPPSASQTRAAPWQPELP